MGTIVNKTTPPPPNPNTERTLGWARGVAEKGIGMSELELMDEGRSKAYIKGYFDAKEFLHNWERVS